MNSFCGARNANLYYENVNNNQIPKSSSLTYEGLFTENQFPLNAKETSKLMAMELSHAIVTNPFDKKNTNELWLGALTKSMHDGSGARRPIDMVVVLDISGSMSSYMGEKSRASCLTLAKEAISFLLFKLDPQDRIGLCTFNDKGNKIFDLQKVEEIANFESHVQPIKANGGTNLYEGLLTGYTIMTSATQDSTARERRILYLTDMQSFNDSSFISLFTKCSEEKIYISVIGIGLDFNADLAEVISHTRGANYFSATKDEHLQKIIVDQFEFNFFPTAFEVELSFQSSDLRLTKCIGTGFRDVNIEVKGQIEWGTEQHKLEDKCFKDKVNFLLLYFNRINKKLPKPILACFSNYMRYHRTTLAQINTCFPSALIQDGNSPEVCVEGGMILLKVVCEKYSELTKRGEICLKYKDGNEKQYEDSYYVKIDVPLGNINTTTSIFSSKAIQNGLILYYYAKLMRRIMKIANNEKKDIMSKYDGSYIKKQNLLVLKQQITDFIKENSVSTEQATELTNKVDTFFDLATKETIPLREDDYVDILQPTSQQNRPLNHHHFAC